MLQHHPVGPKQSRVIRVRLQRMPVYQHPASVRERFRQFAADDLDESRLAEGALLIAQEDYPSLEIEPYLTALQDMAEGVARGAGTELERYESLRETLFEELRYRGNVDAYYDPRNSYLNEVVDRKLGIPITLSLLMVHVGRLAGLQLFGVGLPGHFVVRGEIDGDTFWSDPFAAGATLDQSELERLVSARNLNLEPHMLRPWTARQTLMRLLANLHNIYARSGDGARARRARERIDLLAAGTVIH